MPASVVVWVADFGSLFERLMFGLLDVRDAEPPTFAPHAAFVKSNLAIPGVGKAYSPADHGRDQRGLLGRCGQSLRRRVHRLRGRSEGVARTE
jgi:hypothetical protein